MNIRGQIIHKRCKGAIILAAKANEPMVLVCNKCYREWFLRNMTLQIPEDCRMMTVKDGGVVVNKEQG